MLGTVLIGSGEFDPYFLSGAEEGAETILLASRVNFVYSYMRSFIPSRFFEDIIAPPPSVDPDTTNYIELSSKISLYHGYTSRTY